MATAVLIIGILSSIFSVAHNGYLIAWDVEHPTQRPAMTAPPPRPPPIDMTPVATNLSLDGK